MIVILNVWFVSYRNTRSSYLPRINRASTVIAMSGHRYYVTFIDDYTRCTWVYLLKKKSEVFTTFTHFLQMIKTQYNTILLFVIFALITVVNMYLMSFVLN